MSIPLTLTYFCVATTVAQLAGGAALWYAGVLTQERLLRYAAIVYGFDPADLPSTSESSGTDDTPGEHLTGAEALQARIAASPVLGDREQAIKKGTDSIRTLEQELKSERTRRIRVRQNFAVYLDELQRDVIAASLQEVQRTIEVLQPKQAKQLLLRMLEDEGGDVNDDVLADVVTIVKAMPQDRLKKILGEFKTTDERQQLYRILREIGEFDTR